MKLKSFFLFRGCGEAKFWTSLAYLLKPVSILILISSSFFVSYNQQTIIFLGWFTCFALGVLRGFPLVIPTIFYYCDYKNFETAVFWAVVWFLFIHALLVLTAICDSGCKKKQATQVSSSRPETQPGELELGNVCQAESSVNQDPETGDCGKYIR